MHYVALVELPGESEMISASRRWPEIELAVVFLGQVIDRRRRGDVLESLVLDLPLLDQRLLLILGLLLLDFEVLVDQVLLGDVGELELLEVEIVPTQVALLALQAYGVVLVGSRLVAELDGVHSACDDAALVHRVAVLSSREEVRILLSDGGIQAVFESAKNSWW